LSSPGATSGSAGGGVVEGAFALPAFAGATNVVAAAVVGAAGLAPLMSTGRAAVAVAVRAAGADAAVASAPAAGPAVASLLGAPESSAEVTCGCAGIGLTVADVVFVVPTQLSR
jgi:hypothetical protein